MKKKIVSPTIPNVFTGQSATSESISSFIQPTINEPIPPYEDSGVKYQGYYKKLVSGNKYILKKQIPRFMYIGVDETLPPSGASTYSFTRSSLSQNPNNTFYVTCIEVDVSQSTTPFDLIIYSGNTNNPRYRIHMSSQEKHLVIPLDTSPRSFISDTIILYVNPVLSAGNYVWVGLYGWEEEA